MLIARPGLEKTTPCGLPGKQRYDRFASIAPCKTMDPEMEFELKYEGADDALQLARKAHQKFDKSIFDATSFTVKLMGVGVLKMSSAETAWVAKLKQKHSCEDLTNNQNSVISHEMS